MMRFFEGGKYSKVRDKMLPLIEACGSINGKTVLDVGANDGENTAFLITQGAQAYALEPLKDRLESAIVEGRVPREHAIKATLQDLPAEYFGKFDVVFVSLFSIPFVDREKFFERLSQACKPEGVVVIGTENEEFITGKHGVKTFQSYASRVFFSVNVKTTDSSLNKFVVICRAPKVTAENRVSAEPVSPTIRGGK